MNETPKVVFSHSLKTATWGHYDNARVAGADLEAEVKDLKAQPGKDMVIFGSASIVRQLTELGLVDEYKLWLHPVILAEGKPLFSDLKRRHRLDLTQTKSYANGVVLLNYRKMQQ